MSLGSITAKNALLEASIGDGRASNIPGVFYLAFFNGDPTAGGTELSATGGYGRVSVAWSSAVWNTAASGQKQNGVAIQSNVSTGAWSAQVTHVAFCDTAGIGTGNLWDCGALDTAVTVSAANTIVRFNALAITIAVT